MVKEKKVVMVTVRLTPEEFCLIRREACLGKKSMSVFIRERLFQDAEDI